MKAPSPTPQAARSEDDGLREALARTVYIVLSRVDPAPQFEAALLIVRALMKNDGPLAKLLAAKAERDTLATMVGKLSAEAVNAQVVIATLARCMVAVTEERDEAKGALERDRSTVASTTSKMLEALKGRAWLLEGGRGPYSWDDDRFREEFSGALNEIAAPLEKLRDVARDWSNCPTDPEAIRSARTNWKARNSALETTLSASTAKIAVLTEAVERLEAARPLSEWTEEDGDVLWWRFPIEEPPYVGSPQDSGQTIEIILRRHNEPDSRRRHAIGGWPGYHTHWTPLPNARAALNPTDSHRPSAEGEH